MNDEQMWAILEVLRERKRQGLLEREERLKAITVRSWSPDWRPHRVRRRDRSRCGAKTRSGQPCKAPCVWNHETDTPRNGRCKLHGGLSTGPTTDEGRQRSIAALKAGHRRWRERQQRGGQR
jgi:hypothetical protein